MSEKENKLYKNNVEIGGEVFEQIEYMDYTSDINCLRELFNEKVNFWDKITIPFARAKYVIKDFCWNIRYGFQRMFKEYDCVDTFEIYYKFAKRYHKILTEYKKNMYGYPACMTKEEWDNIVDEMITHLYYMDEDNVTKELENGMEDRWSPSLETTSKIMEVHKDKFFKLFSEYFYYLWD